MRTKNARNGSVPVPVTLVPVMALAALLGLGVSDGHHSAYSGGGANEDCGFHGHR